MIYRRTSAIFNRFDTIKGAQFIPLSSQSNTLLESLNPSFDSIYSLYQTVDRVYHSVLNLLLATLHTNGHCVLSIHLIYPSFHTIERTSAITVVIRDVPLNILLIYVFILYLLNCN